MKSKREQLMNDKELWAIQVLLWGIVTLMLINIGLNFFMISGLLLIIFALCLVTRIRGISAGILKVITDKKFYTELYDSLYDIDTHEDKS